MRFVQTKSRNLDWEFETASETRRIEFFYLLPKSPKLNSHVESLNRAWQEDFYHSWIFDNHSFEQIKRFVDLYAQENIRSKSRYEAPVQYLKKVCNIG